ncbi:hypothetical protein [Streptomyces sp. NPDC086766]|uniref:hypothetical protein n=1 Tax=Streptomyces sp. NPDC086766 TaxID=3365754 RepID=UPI0038115D72
MLAVTGAALLPAPHAVAGTRTVGAAPRDEFDGDGYADLAVAAPWATVGGKKGAGYGAVLYGSASGLRIET